MDLIYADENKIEIGVIPEYEFDIAFGSDENDFELTLDVSSHCCKPDIIFTLKIQSMVESLIKLKLIQAQGLLFIQAGHGMESLKRK